MEQWPLIQEHLLVPLIALAVLGVLNHRRCLEPDVFDGVAPRRTGIVLLDFIIGVWILLAASMLIIPVLSALRIPLPGDNPPPTLRQSAVSTLIQQVITHLPIVLFLLWRASAVPDGLRELGAIPRRPWRDVAVGALALLAALPMVLGSSAVMMLLSRLMLIEAPTIGHDMLRAMQQSPDALATAIMVVSAVLVAPVLEEFVYRGLVQSSLLAALGPQRRWVVILLAASLFAFIHGGIATWQVLPGLFILGVTLGWLYERHGSLLPGIVLHMLFNVANIAIAMMIADGRS